MSKIKTTEEEIIKEFGKVFYTGSALKADEGKIIPTTLSMDIALNGGIPEGTITNLAGKPKCLGGNTLVYTNNGVRKLKDCNETDIRILSRTGMVDAKFIDAGEDDLYRINFEDGSYIDATSDHEFLVPKSITLNNLERVKLSDFKSNNVEFIPFCMKEIYEGYQDYWKLFTMNEYFPIASSIDFAYLKIQSIEFIGKQNTYCFETETSDFIANGLYLGNCGKTTLCLSIVANAQRMKKKCFYLDIEGRLRTDLLKTIPGLIWTDEQEKQTGFPQLQVIRSSEEKILSAEDYINIMDTLIKEVPGCLIILDSIAALTSQDVMATKAGDSKRMASIPTLMYFFLRKAAAILPVTKASILTITHLQANPSGYGGPNQVGGNAIQYFASNRFVCHSVEKVPANGPLIGHNAKFKCESAALGPPGGEFNLYVRYGKGADKEEDLVSTAEELGFIEKSGAWYKFTSGSEEIKLQGKQKCVEYFKENPDKAAILEKQIRDQVIKN